MALDQTFYCTFLDKKSRSKFLCYTRSQNGTFKICADCTQDLVDQCVGQMFATEEKLLKLRSACLRGDVSVVVHDTSAEVCGGWSPDELRVRLSRLEAPEAAEELKELLFTMADSLSESAGASAFRSPLKHQQRWPAESEAQQNSAPSVTPKKRPARTSLINPGAKKKLEAAGVTFDDAETDP